MYFVSNPKVHQIKNLIYSMADEEMKYTNKILSKWEFNHLWMQKYRKESMSDEQKEKVKMYDRMHAAKKRLEEKIEKQTKKENNRIQKQKSWLMQERNSNFPSKIWENH